MNAPGFARGLHEGPGWVLTALLVLTQRAHGCLARAGARQLEAEPATTPEESMRFMNDLSGGGSRAREAARGAALAPDGTGAPR